MRSAGGRRKARASPKPPRSAAKVERQLAELTAELRLRTAERDEALAQQAASAEVFEVINSSPGDLGPVFDAILDKAMHLCGTAFGALGTWQGERFAMVAMRGGERLAHHLATNETSLGPRSGFARVAEGDGYVQFADISQSKFYRSGDPHTRALVDLGGARSTLTVPLAKEGEVLGLLLFYRQEVQRFSEQEITLVKSFAAQAVIAMENARLLEAVNDRNRDLEQSLERQTATSDILGAIAASPGEAEGTLRKIAETTARLFSTAGVSFRMVEGDEFKLSVGVGRGAEQVTEALWENPARRPTPGGASLPATVVRENRQIQIRDLDNLDPEMADWPGPPVARAAGIRTMVGTPLRSGGQAIGAMMVYRDELRPFDPVELQLLQSFADQAVIAIENARLLTETREALERQTATAEVLQVINASPGHLTPVFEAMLEKATRLCEAGFGVLWLYEGERFRAGATHALPAAMVEFCRVPVATDAGASLLGIARGGGFVHVADCAVSELYKAGNPMRRAAVDLGGARTLLSVPLRKDDALLGAFTIYRQEVKPFSDKQIALVQNFAAQAVIAMENARLLDELRQRTGDLEESLEYQTATSDVLKVISRSTFDLQPVLDVLAETAGRLCQADYAAILRRDGDVYRIATAVGYSPEMMEDAQRYRAYLEQHPLVPGRGSVTGRVALEGRAVHVVDTASDPEYVLPATELGKLRTRLGVPLLREGSPIGVIILGRQRVEAFSQRQVELVTTFADQAIIAIENARLLSEQHDALERQTATAEVLQVINSSPGDLAPVFEAILEKAHRLCAVAHGSLQLYDGEKFRAVAVHGLSPQFADRLRQGYAPGPNVPSRRLLEGARFAQAADLAEIDDPVARAAAELSGIRTTLFIPLRKDGVLLGQIVAARLEVRPFTEKEITLLESFAAQAVIAMENARLLGELRQRTRDLEESLEYQTATSDVLKVISRSTFDLQPVLETLARTAARLCSAEMALISLRDGDAYRAGAAVGFSSEFAAFIASHPLQVDRGTVVGRVALDRRIVHIVDVAADPEYRLSEAVTLTRQHTSLGVPLLREDEVIGVIVLARQRVESFTPKQIDLVATFADQAVIAIENTRLLTEQREALEQQTATAEVLQVINSSPGNLAPVFEAVLDKATRLCDFAFSILWTYDGEAFRAVAMHGVPERYAAYLAGHTIVPPPNTEGAFWQFIAGKDFVHIDDVAATPLDELTPRARGAVEMGGARTNMLVALRKDQQLLGAIEAYRTEVRPFSDKQVALLKNFAAQAVIAMENARLITETREALEQQTATAEVLRVINSSPGELSPVFDAILEKAHSLCAVDHGSLQLYDGEKFHAVATHGLYGALPDWMRQPYRPGPNHPIRQLLEGARFAQVSDWAEIDDPRARALAESGLRTTLFIPLRKDNTLLGHIGASRSEVRPFSEKEIALLENFAAQAVIAMENARLITETREALEQQTATAEVLQVINSSPGDLTPVFDAMLEKAMRLCEAAFGILLTHDGTRFHRAATRGVPAAYSEFYEKNPPIWGPRTGPGQVLEEKRVLQMIDAMDTDLYRSGDHDRHAIVDLAGARTLLLVPLLKDDVVRGILTVYRQEVRPFSDKQVALLQNFAAQAVIAMENARLITETREALEQQTATAEILQVINSSPGNLEPVFDAILEKAHRLCGVTNGVLVTKEGEYFRTVATRGVKEDAVALLRRPFRAMPNTPHARLSAGERIVHIADITVEERWDRDDPRRASAIDRGIRTALFVPLRKDDALLGYISANRHEVRPFSDKEIKLLESFAAQAVIAMENARLLEEIRHRNDELAEALEFQTATGEVLRIVASSPDHLQPVFDAMLEKATELCEAKFGTLFLYDGNAFTVAAERNLPPAYAEAVRGKPFSAETNTALRHLLESKAPVHIKEMFGDAAYAGREPLRMAAVELGGVRSLVAVPLLKKGELIGFFSIYREEPGGFAENQIALVTTFADQAVIAIENARLFRELRDRQAELSRSVDELTATGDVLKIISRSSVDLGTVLETLVETVRRLCRADQTYMFRLREEMWHLVASSGLSAEAKEFFHTHPFTPGRGSTPGRAVLERRPVLIPDVLADPEYTLIEGQRRAGYRTTLGIPLLREDTLIGVYGIARTRVEPFTDKEIELAITFADQAVIAIENARLFEELRDRQAELRTTFDNMGDGVVMFDAEGRLTAWNRNFQEMLELPDAFLAGRPSHAEYFRYLADRGEYTSADLEEQLSRTVEDTQRELRFERTRPDGRVIEVRRNAVPDGGFVMIYSDITERKRAEAAINAARDAAEAALRELQTAQASLLHAQKMAALGQLTAGIAHEIKNPLNFVNNFASLASELLDELKEATAPAMTTLDADKRAEIDETIEMLTGNLKKIVEHGRRADGIVKSMLAHSRGGSGDWQAVDLNAIVEEALNLAYHGARAQDQSFNITMERDLDRNLAPVEVVPQDVTRVFLNLIGNGFYAANKRKREADAAFRPVLQVATRDLGDAVEIRVRDNGIGIAREHRERLFQPFFTTKPTGEGTGLGLSISYDIVTQQHGGDIIVDSEVGSFTEFTVRLPRRRHVATAGRSA
ncbi:MAG TPA: GAF domain-containing protein [Stellaceae bacterium]|nr:GAF domain-containing protein [Stellaceae bacterium]